MMAPRRGKGAKIAERAPKGRGSPALNMHQRPVAITRAEPLCQTPTALRDTSLELINERGGQRNLRSI